MPPFPVPSNAGWSGPESPPASGSHSSNPFASLFKTIGRNVTKATSSGTEASPHSQNVRRDSVSSKDTASTHSGSGRPQRANMAVGSSSRGAGVRPKRSKTDPLQLTDQEEGRDLPLSSGIGGYSLAGPSRGGFITQTRGKAGATVAASSIEDFPPSSSRNTSPGATSSRGAGNRPILHPSAPIPRLPDLPLPVDPSPLPSPSLFVETEDPVLPPSKILPRLYETEINSPDRTRLIPLIRLLAQSVTLYPFPPPALAAISLSDALASHPTSPTEEMPSPLARPSARPSPTPVQIYLSQSRHLSKLSPPKLRAATLALMNACLEASIGATGGMKEGDKAIYWDEARRWAEEAKVEVNDGQGGVRWALPDADREGLVAVLSSLTKGGRDLTDVPGLVALLCTFVTDSLPNPRPPSPLFDPQVTTPFIRTRPIKPSPHTSSLALLTAIHKFSAPHIYTASTLLALRAALEVAKLQEERDIGGHADTGVLAFLGAVVRFGEVTGGKAARTKARLGESDITISPDAANPNEGDEILREVVSVVARIIGCEGLVGVIELEEGQSAPGPDDFPTKASILPPLALELMRDLIRSPANQALKSLRNTLIAPPTSGSRPPTPILLLVGTLRALRKALVEHSAEVEANRGDASGTTQGESRWPSLLSLGLPYLWSGICRVMQWESGRVDAEVLRLVEERLDAAERTGNRSKEPAAATGSERGVEEVEGGVSYEEWDMTIEVLSKAKWHISAWEGAKSRPWTLMDVEVIAGEASDDDDDEDAEEDMAASFTRRPNILAAFGSLLRKVIRAWCEPGFTGPSDRLFSLLLSLAPNLPDTFASLVIDQCEANDLCLPSHPDWLDRTQEVVKAFYVLPHRSTGPRAVRRGASPATRRRTLLLLLSLHSHLRQLDSLRDTLVGTVILPLLETTFEAEPDVEVAEVMLSLMSEIARDALVDGEEQDGEEGPLDSFDRLRLLLVRTAKGSVRPFDRYTSSVPTTPKSKRAPLASLSRYHKDNSPTSMRSSPSISAPVSQPTQASSAEPIDVSYIAVLGLISTFHLCLARATDPASTKAIVVFRDLLALLSPAASPNADILTDSVVSLRTRVVILQWLVRLRADASHRVHWVKKVDITNAATILGRVGVATEHATEALSEAVGRNSEEGPRPEMRGRSARQVTPGEPRSSSGSRLRMQSQERSPSRLASGRRGSSAQTQQSAAPLLWTAPESLPFDFGDAVRSVGGKGLASFDHNRMRFWTEEEDPGTGQLKVKEVPDTAPHLHAMMVLPVSEYLAVVNHILQHDQEWELFSYLLCHLPEQLCNKHFACGPRAAQQIHVLRRIFCDGLRATDRSDRPFPATIPAGIKRAEIHAVAYQCLTDLIPYRSLFSKAHQDEMVDTFMFGLGNPRDTAKPCIHALGMASYELRPSVTKHLAEINRHLQKIISSATLGVHILEFIAGVGQEPQLYANFTEVDFQTVFGIALKYIQAHNERLADNPKAFEEEDSIEYAFSQYVFLLAYYSIAAWFLALRLSERPKYVPFLTRRLVQANEGKAEVDEPTEVCFDMIARYTFSNADPRPRPSPFDDIITVGRTSTSPSKTWIVGHSTFTIRSLKAPAWVEVTIRRPSGVVRMLWEMQNIAGVTSASENNLIAMYLRHRDTLGVSIPSAVSAALATLPGATRQPHLGHRSRSVSFSEGTTTPGGSNSRAIEDNTVADVINQAAAVANQPTLESGLLSVDPSFFTLQLSSFPEFGKTGPPLLVPNDPAFQRGITALDRMPVVDFHKIGVLYAGAGQRTEKEILCNTHGSKAYIEFISQLGKLIRLKDSRQQDIYVGGLDQESDLDGKWTYIWDDDIAQIVFHVATLMPTSPSTDPQATLKKRHIGNDFVKVIFNDSGEEFAFDTLPGDFNIINIVIQPHTPAGNPWLAPGMTNNAEFFKVSMQRRPGMPEVGPLGQFKVVGASSLPHLVRQLALHADIFASVYLSVVGMESSRGGAGIKMEYSSNWRRRLQQVRTLRKKILAERGEGAASAGDQRLDLEAAELARSFTAWL